MYSNDIRLNHQKRLRVLHSFPLRLGADRICGIAWHQVDGLAAAGAEVTAFPAAISRPLPSQVKVRPTLALGKLRLPNRLLGKMAYAALHDWIVARRIEKMAGQIDIIHTWPVGALQTLKTAARLGIPTVLERCNAHTRFAYEVVNRECERLGVALPPDHEHAWNEKLLRKEEEEYRLAYRLLCPSDFVVKTFLDQGFEQGKLVRHTYGFDEKVFFPDEAARDPQRNLTVLFAGVCAVRKGLHYALEAWLQSAASHGGSFLIAGKFLPAYEQKLSGMLVHPSVKVLGHRHDVPELMRRSDILVLPTIEEGSALVCLEAIGSGCVPLVSDVCTDPCRHMENSLIHHVGDVKTFAQHLTTLHNDHALLEKLRTGCLRLAPEITWAAAGVKLLQGYRQVLAASANR